MKKTIIFLGLAFLSALSFAKENQTPPPGFLTYEEMPKVAQLVAPPKENSLEFKLDIERYQEWAAKKEDPRVKIAHDDAPVKQNDIASRFAEAFGYDLTQEKLPHLFSLFKRVTYDIYFTTRAAKKEYLRIRPFVRFKAKTCYPEEEKNVKPNHSFPSGHSVVGWTFALLMSEINPERQNELFKRGLEYGQSRVICGYHWQSDVDAGRIVASALVARLHANAEFLEALQKAKNEWQIKKLSQ